MSMTEFVLIVRSWLGLTDGTTYLADYTWDGPGLPVSVMVLAGPYIDLARASPSGTLILASVSNYRRGQL